MAEKLLLEVVTPERAVLRESVDDVVLPGELGQMDVFPGHLPLLTSLTVGQMVITADGKQRYLLIDQGFAEIADNRVTVLTESCDGASDIDVEQAKRALEEAEARIKELETISTADVIEEETFEKHRLALKRQRMRLAFAEERAGDD